MYNFYAEITKNNELCGHSAEENEDFKFEFTEDGGHIKGTVTAFTDLTFRSLSLKRGREFGFDGLIMTDWGTTKRGLPRVSFAEPTCLKA